MLKKINVIFLVLVSFISLQSTAIASDSAELLKQKLAQLSGFSAQFEQEVTDRDGQVVQQSQGYVELIQPDKFRWVTAEPNENTLQSDGETVWFYDPFVEQVTAYWLKDTIQSNPILLLLKPNSNAWDAYQISQQAESVFTISTQDEQSQVVQVKLELANKNALSSLSILDKQGQTSVYHFSQFSAQQVSDFSDNHFNFELPDGVELDDQRR